jgi:TfoX/Sxy family transcriptional regulator of competence genes
MAYDMITAERIRHVLAGRDVVEKQMMGSLCLMVDGRMCCCTKDDMIMVRIGSEGHARALAEPHVRPFEMRGRCVSGFVRVAAAGFATDSALRRWIERGLAFVATLPAKKTGKRRKPARTGFPLSRE